MSDEAAQAAAEEVAKAAAAAEEVAQAAAEGVPQAAAAVAEGVPQAAAEEPTQEPASPPPGPSPQRPSKDEFFCSFQNSVEVNLQAQQLCKQVAKAAAAAEEVAQAAAEGVPQAAAAVAEGVPQAAAEEPTQEPASPPPGPSPQRPSKDEFFCSFQNSVEDVRWHVFDVAKGTPAYVGTLAAMRSRQFALSPFLFHGAPVTPLINPKANFSSHFIIRLFNSEELRYMVDCLVRDSDLYFVGFRRHLLLTAEEKAQLLEKERNSLPKKKKGKGKGKGNKEEKGGWGTWYRFSDGDMHLPEYFEAESCGMSSAYSEKTQATAGGVAAVREMLFAFATFQDNPIVDTAFKKACYRFMIMFCEACRLRSVFRVTTKRFDDNITYVVPDYLWASINSWGQRGRDVLHARLRGRDLDFDISYKGINVKGQILKTLDDLVGPRDGEVLLIRSNRTLMGHTEAEMDQIDKKAVQTNTGPADRREIHFSVIR